MVLSLANQWMRCPDSKQWLTPFKAVEGKAGKPMRHITDGLNGAWPCGRGKHSIASDNSRKLLKYSTVETAIVEGETVDVSVLRFWCLGPEILTVFLPTWYETCWMFPGYSVFKSDFQHLQFSCRFYLISYSPEHRCNRSLRHLWSH